ncbi:hypothetical protein BLNAU_14194 [Blattamonas nauphoetae]|uniref:Uncharacterized protein n=1 Tax=Blattamonas nauphoetae TaxID=2049346 RepID=A0ABQ9XJV8_9EUKA|nr:hypothetical protein BLNAU_14194 [Blattamonas nauphoetae]
MSQTSSQNLTPSNTDSQPQVSLITNTPLPRQSRSILSAAIAPHSSSLKTEQDLRSSTQSLPTCSRYEDSHRKIIHIPVSWAQWRQAEHIGAQLVVRGAEHRRQNKRHDFD